MDTDASQAKDGPALMAAAAAETARVVAGAAQSGPLDTRSKKTVAGLCPFQYHIRSFLLNTGKKTPVQPLAFFFKHTGRYFKTRFL